MTLRFEVTLKFDHAVDPEVVRRAIEATLEMEYYPGAGIRKGEVVVYPSDVEVSVL